MKYITTFVMGALTLVMAQILKAGYAGTVCLAVLMFVISALAWRDPPTAS